MNKTQNYQLNQWEKTDKVRMEDFNADNAKIDAAMAGLAQAVAGKADQAATSTAMAGKADRAELAALQGVIGAKGNCRIAVGTYTGNGGKDSGKKVTITFPYKPLALLVAGGSYLGVSLFLRPHKSAVGCDTGGTGSTLVVAWGENSVSWYVDGYVSGSSVSTGTSAQGQLNESGKTYTYLVIGEA